MPGRTMTLQELQGSAAAGGDVGDLVGKAAAAHSSRGVAAADDGDGVALGQGLGDSDGAVGKAGFSNTPMGPFQTTVLRGLDGAGRTARWSWGRCPGPSCRRGLRRRLHSIDSASGGNSVASTVSTGQQELNALLLGLGHHVLGSSRPCRRPAGRCRCRSPGRQEGVGHAAADDERVDLLQQVVDDARACRRPWHRPEWRRRDARGRPGLCP